MVKGRAWNRRDAAATGRAAAAGLVAGPVFALAHGIFLAWVVPPLIVGSIVGALGGAAMGPALARARTPIGSLHLAGALVASLVPLGFVAFLVRPWAGDGIVVVAAASLASVIVAAWLGRFLHAGWRGVLGLMLVAAFVSGPGEPFVHEGPEPRIVGFYAGLLVALASAGALAARLATPGEEEPRKDLGDSPALPS